MAPLKSCTQTCRECKVIHPYISQWNFIFNTRREFAVVVVPQWISPLPCHLPYQKKGERASALLVANRLSLVLKITNYIVF